MCSRKSTGKQCLLLADDRYPFNFCTSDYRVTFKKQHAAKDSNFKISTKNSKTWLYENSESQISFRKRHNRTRHLFSWPKLSDFIWTRERPEFQIGYISKYRLRGNALRNEVIIRLSFLIWRSENWVLSKPNRWRMKSSELKFHG